MDKFLVIFSLGSLSFFSFFAPVAFSQNDCTIVFGGGEIDCEATVTATAKVTPSPTRSDDSKQTEQQPATPSARSEDNSKQMTKGGLPVYEPAPASETPATGPEALALVTLLPAAALGFYLRKKTK